MIQGYLLPLAKTQQTPKEVKQVKILTGKYKGKIRDFCHYVDEGSKVVVHVDVCKYLTYKVGNVAFVESEFILVTEFY